MGQHRDNTEKDIREARSKVEMTSFFSPQENLHATPLITLFPSSRKESNPKFMFLGD